MSRAAEKTSNHSSGYETDIELPVGKNLSETVKAMVAVWRAGSERKADMNDSQWSAVKNQQRDPTVVLKKGEAGFKEWDDLRNWLKQTGWVDVEWEDEEGDPRAPDEGAIADAAEVEAFAEAVDTTMLAAVERVLGVFDPSTYGTDTNPVVTDFLAELLHDPDPMAAELGSVLGRGSFNATSSARQYDHFILNDAHGSESYAAEMREAWGCLQAATAGHLGDALARQMEREVEAASSSQKELTAFLDQATNYRLRNEVCALPATIRERILFNQLDAASGMWTVAIPTTRTAMIPHELREVTAGYFLLPSSCLAPVVGSQFILPSTGHIPVTVDLYGDARMNLPAPGDAHWRVQHDAIADAFRDHCVHDLGIAARREVDDLFQQAVPLGNTVPRDELKDLVPDAELSLPAFNVVTGSYDPGSLKSTLLEFKTMRYGVKYTAVPRATAVDRFERSLLGDIQRGLAARDAAWHNTEP
eukprot:jgi/Tetstr1/450226/TSEL_037264.t1